MPPARESLAASAPQAQIPVGATIGGRFRVEGLAQQDAVSQTYRATDLAHSGAAAIRIVPMRVLGPAAEQLESDVERAGSLVHKNLVEVVNIGREADFFYIATEQLDGQTLRDFVDARRREGRNVSFKGTCNLITHVANGLERAASILPHGGLNPSAIWVNKAGRVKVAELGLSRALPLLARRGAPQGAPDQAYVAPEVLGGQQATLQSDVYSLGIILYEVLTGRLPTAPLRPPSQIAEDAPPAIDGVVMKALARDPNARFASVMDLRQALASVQAGGTGLPAAAARPMAAAPAPAPMPAPAAAPRPAAVVPTAPGEAHQAQVEEEAPEARRSTFGRSFNVAEVAGGAVDDAQERWLIQKDRLDFGPFSLAQIRAQIERGEILGEHMIVDSDTGARKKVKDFPALRDFSKTSERRLEQQRRAHAEIKHEKSEKRKSAFTRMFALIALLVVGGGVAFFVFTRKASDNGTLSSREEEADIDAFLKDVKLNISGGQVKNRAAGGGHHASHSSGPAGDGDFSADQNFGDASKYASAGDEVLDDGVIEDTMRNHYRGLIPCLMGERHKNPSVSEMSVDFVIRGTGKVSAVKVNGQKGGAFASCVLGRMPIFPKFNGVKTIASWSMSMR
jgi:serine/threonine-protein kinase